MTEQHPITPPPELIEKWHSTSPLDRSVTVATQAARWGSDQELEACIQYFHEYDPSWGEDSELIAGLRAARRPKPPSLKEQALEAWDRLRNEAWCEEIDYDLDFVRRALEALDD